MYSFTVKYFNYLRATIIVLILYFGWLGIMVIATPATVYLRLRQDGASYLEAIFLSTSSCLLVSWGILYFATP